MSTGQPHERGRLFAQHVDTLIQRYSSALEHCAADRALVFAGPLVFRDRDDQPYPWRADPYFLQWASPPDAAGSVLEFRPGHKPLLHLASEDDYWHAGTMMPPDYVAEVIEVTPASPSDILRRLADSPLRTVCVGRANGRGKSSQFEANSTFIEYLDFDRAIKTQYEADCIYRANLKAAAGHRAVAQALRDGVSEFDLHIRYCEAAGLSDEDLPYPNIIGLNEHASILHYQRRDTTPPARTVSLLIDAGAQEQAYAADVTRTYSVNNERFAALILAMEKLQQDVCSRVTAGVDFVELNELCHQRLAEVLSEFGFVTCSAETAYEHGVTTAFLPHGLGHLLGLQVHDVGGRSIDRSAAPRDPPQRHPFLRLTRTLQPGMVLTIEPGIYFIEQLIAAADRDKPGMISRTAVEEFVDFGGIRIEDNLRVESRGHDNLTRSAFAE